MNLNDSAGMFFQIAVAIVGLGIVIELLRTSLGTRDPSSSEKENGLRTDRSSPEHGRKDEAV